MKTHLSIYHEIQQRVRHTKDLKKGVGGIYSPYPAMKTPIVDKGIPNAGDLEHCSFYYFALYLWGGDNGAHEKIARITRLY